MGAGLAFPFVAGFAWHLLWTWADLGEDWVSVYIVAIVGCLLSLVRPVAEALLWSWLGEVAGRGVEVARALLGRTGVSTEPSASVAAALVGWLVVQLVDSASQDIVVRVILLATAVVVLAVALLPLVLDGGGGRRGGGSARDDELLSLPLPNKLAGGDGKLKLVLDM